MHDDILVLINEQSGRVKDIGAGAIEEDLIPILDRNGSYRIVHGQMEELLGEANSCQARTLVSVGGDGTIGAISKALIDCKATAVFVPLPYGTANLIPRDLDFPLQPTDALRRALRLKPRKIDYAEAAGRPLLHSAVLGTFAEAAEARELFRSAPTFEDRMGAASEWFDRLFFTEPQRYDIEIDGRSYDTETNAIFITNNPITHGEAGVPRRSQLDTGQLCVYISDSKGPFGFIQRILEAVAGGFEDSHGITKLVGSDVSVRGPDDEIHFTIDGEPFISDAKTEVRMVMKPSCLTVPDFR